MRNEVLKTKKKILVLGANGKTGSRVMQRLTKLGWPVQGASRSTDPKFDWNDSATWKAAFQGINAVYISFQPDLAIPGTGEIIQQLTKAAVEEGIQQLVLLSGRGEEEAQRCEEIVMKAGVEWTIVRASWFNQNFSEGHILEPVRAGHVALPAGDIGVPFIDADDIADVAVAALTEEGHNGEVYEVTGPRVLTFKKAVQEIADITGKPIQFEEVPMKAYASVLAEYNLPGEIIWLITYLFTEVLIETNASVTGDVERALGRKPTDFREYVKKAAASGVWN